MDPQTLIEKAIQTYAAVQAHYYIPEESLYRENSTPRPTDKPFSFLWPFSAVLSGVNALARLPAVGERYRADLLRTFDTLEQYYNGTRPATLPAYEAYVRRFGGDTKFYDDNEWLGMEFVEAYRLLGDAYYLAKAQEMFAFAISGWTDEWAAGSGGIYWNEKEMATKNTCSNGPAAVLALMLYGETQRPDYLQWAQRLLRWLDPLKAPEGIYWDALNADGSIDTRIFTYNAGTPLHTNALLYSFTDDERYLNEARSLAEAAHRYFAIPHDGSDLPLYPATPWFNGVLLRGYIALYAADPNPNRQYIDAMRDNLLYAWDHARDANGLFSNDWSGASGVDNPHKPILDQGAMIELYALLAAFYARL